MYIDLYVAQLRLGELREQAARHRRLQAILATRPGWRLTAPHALARLARRLLGGPPGARSPAGTIGAARKHPC
jgi:hypothetical protein